VDLDAPLIGEHLDVPNASACATTVFVRTQVDSNDRIAHVAPATIPDNLAEFSPEVART